MSIKTKHKIINGDSRQMNELEDRSIDLVITSPPYWQLKDYGVDNQIGYNDSYEEYINNLNLVWKESFRVLSNGSRLCVNILDPFHGNGTTSLAAKKTVGYEMNPEFINNLPSRVGLFIAISNAA